MDAMLESEVDDLEQFADNVKWRQNKTVGPQRGVKASTLLPPYGLIHHEQPAYPKVEKPPTPVIEPSPVTTPQFQAAEVVCYSQLIERLKDRVGHLGVRYLDFDKLAGFAEGLTGKSFGAAQVKRLGVDKLFDAIRAAGLRLRVEEDPEQAQKMQARIAENFLPRQARQARPGNRSHLSGKLIEEVLSHLVNKKGGLTTLNLAVKRARSNLSRQAWERKRATGDFAALRPPEEPGSAEANAA